MESRNVILERLRSSRAPRARTARSHYSAQNIFADIPGETLPELVERFQTKLSALKGEVRTVNSQAEAASAIAALIRDSGFKRCARQKTPLLDTLFAKDALAQDLVSKQVTDSMLELGNQTLLHRDIETLDCAFTAADALIARTGSVVLRATTAGGRRLSVLPPVHCVVATSDQLRPTIASWLVTVHADQRWSYSTIITGPSRTADIERILVLGAHGPKRLIVIIINH